MPEDFKTYNVFEAQPKRIAIEYPFAKGFEVFVLLVLWRVSNLVPSQWFWILMLVVTWFLYVHNAKKISQRYNEITCTFTIK